MKTRKLVAAACAIALSFAPAAIPQSQAGTTTTNLSVSTSISGTCSITAGQLAFAAYTGALDSASASVTVTCSSDTGFAPFITLNTNASGQRNLVNGASTLPYTLCEDTNCVTPITNTTHFAVNYSTGGTANTIFGQIPASESGLTGNYSDTALITLNF